MTRLRGKAELALREERDSETYREALADSLEASESAVTLLDSIMDVAEAESGTMPLRAENVRLADLVADVADVYRLIAEEKSQVIDIDVPPRLEVRADRSRMRQVVANLVDNALKYTPHGGHVHISAEADGKDVRLTVRDTGIGIPSEEQHRIFDRLYRGDKSRSERGLGLGLSLVKAVVEAHGGQVAVRSCEGRGAEFVVRLPAAHDLTNL